MKPMTSLPSPDGTSRSPGQRFEPYPLYKDTGVEWLGRIPSHWDAARLWRISRSISGGTPAREERAYWDGGIPWVSPKDMKRRIIDSSEDTVTELAIRETGLRVVDPPAVLVVVRGMILARSFPVGLTTVPVTINQDMKALTFRKNVDPGFMAWAFEGIGRGLLSAIVDEAAHGTRAIRMDQWRWVTVPIPPEGEQKAVAAFLERETARIDGLVAKKERLIELLHERRSALITRAVTRGLDLSVAMRDSGVDWLGEVPAHWDVRSNVGLFQQRLEHGRDDLPILEVSIAFGVRLREFSDTKIEQRSDDPGAYKVACAGDIAFNKMRLWQGAVGTTPVTGLVSPDYVVAVPRDGGPPSRDRACAATESSSLARARRARRGATAWRRGRRARSARDPARRG